MSKKKFGVAVDEETVEEIDDIAEECKDIAASRSGIIDAILTEAMQREFTEVENIREIIKEKRASAD